jgi:Concanavalin A-like lectin/glucanases superfamily
MALSNVAAYYKLNGNSLKSIGSNNGTDTNVTYSSGLIGQAAVYNGSSSITVIPASSDFNFGSSDFGISIWFKKNLNGVRQCIFGSCNSLASSNSLSFIIEFNSSNIVSVLFSYGALDIRLSDTTAITDTNWHNLIITRSGNNFYLYIDSVLKATLTASIFINTTSFPPTIGRLGDYIAGFYFNGSVDEVGIFKQSLTSDVAKLYNSGRGLTYPFNNNKFFTIL